MFFKCLKCIILTCLGSYPFYLALTHKLDTRDDFVPCDLNETCHFIRFVGTEKLPATTRGGYANFVEVVNGRNISFADAAEGTFSFESLRDVPQFMGFVAYEYANFFAGLWSRMVHQEQEDFPSPEHVNETICDSQEVRKQIENHLDYGWTRNICLCGILAWTVLKIVHDLGLLLEVPEVYTLGIGLLSWMAQAVACGAAFSWGSAAMEVFIARVPEKLFPEVQGACYYRLGLLDTLTALITPVTLLQLAHFKLANLNLSIVNGDYLYFEMYDVPYRVVKATAASHPLLVMGLRGDQGFPSAPCHQLNFQHMKILSDCARGLNLFWFIFLWLYVSPLGFGSMFLRLTTVAASHDWSSGLWGGVKVAALMVATLPPLLLICFACWLILNHFCVSFRESESAADITGLLVIVVIFFVFLPACCFVECVSIFNVLNQQDIIGLEQCWEWYLYGNTITFFSIFLLIYGVDAVDDPSVIDLVSAHTEFDDSTMPKIIEASDRHQSHVELVLEIFQDDLPEQLYHLRPRESNTDEGYDSLRESCEPGTEMTQRELRIGETGRPSDAKPLQSA